MRKSSWITLKLLCWNIQNGGGTRIPRIVEELASYDPDVVAVTEFRALTGVVLSAAIRERGLPYVETTAPAGNQDGIAVFSRTPIRRLPSAVPDRWLDLDLPEYGFSLGVLHIMAAGSSAKSPATVAKTRFWDAILRAAEAKFREPSLLVGDWNTGAHHSDETGKTFICADRFGKLSSMGWTDLWRRHNPGATEYTWYSKFKGGARRNGFRLDHAFATPGLSTRVSSCRYSHAERDAGVTAHSMVVLEVESE